MSDLTVTPPQAAAILCQPGVKVNLLGWIESNCQVKTYDPEKPCKGVPYLPSPTAKQRKRDDMDKLVKDILPRGIVRFTKTSIRTLSDYETAVNNARERAGLEANYKAGSHPFAESYRNSRIVYRHRDNGRLYITLRLNQKSCVETTAELRDSDGKPLNYDAVWTALQTSELREERAKKREKDAERQGLDSENAVMYRNFAIDNVTRFCYAGHTFNVQSNEPTGQTVEAAEIATVQAILNLLHIEVEG